MKYTFHILDVPQLDTQSGAGVFTKPFVRHTLREDPL